MGTGILMISLVLEYLMLVHQIISGLGYLHSSAVFLFQDLIPDVHNLPCLYLTGEDVL
jgi:hypothetical protein